MPPDSSSPSVWYHNRTYREVDGRIIRGITLPAFIHNGNYYLTSIEVYQDGVINCWGLMSFEEFKFKVESGWVVTALPEGALVTIGKFIWFTATQCQMPFCSRPGDPSDLIKDVANAMDHLNGKPTAQVRLIQSMWRIKEDDTPEARQLLKRAYTDLPSWDRQFAFGSAMEGRKDIQEIIAQTILEK